MMESRMHPEGKTREEMKKMIIMYMDDLGEKELTILFKIAKNFHLESGC